MGLPLNCKTVRELGMSFICKIIKDLCTVIKMLRLSGSSMIMFEL